MKKIDLNNWVRKAQYEFFKDFEDPYFNVTSNIDCTNCYLNTKETGESFFVRYMHKALKALNEIQEFRLRIVANEVIEFEKINGTTTVFKEDNTFSFCYFDYLDDYSDFYKNTRQALKIAKTSDKLVSKSDLNLIYVSVIPWRSFTSIKHPRSGDKTDSVPKIVFGKVFKNNDKFVMPVSVDAHHSLVDGFHVSQFFNRFEQLLSEE